jgi:hypothetical protein
MAPAWRGDERARHLSSRRRPNGIYIPRFRNLERDDTGYHRGYGYQGMVMRQGWRPVADGEPGIGVELKQRVRKPAWGRCAWRALARCCPIPRTASRCMPKVDEWGIPQLNIDCAHGENEKQLGRMMLEDAKAMLIAAGGASSAKASCTRRGLAFTRWARRAWGAIPRPRF